MDQINTQIIIQQSNLKKKKKKINTQLKFAQTIIYIRSAIGCHSNVIINESSSDIDYR